MRATPRSLRTALVALAVLPACSFDGEPFQEPVCLGSHLLEGVCLASSPSGDLRLSGSTSIDTTRLGTDGCTEILPQSAGPSVCVVAATSIHVPSKERIHAIAFPDSARPGTHPLVLFATDSIVIEGTLDVSSGEGDLVVGSGARTAVGCGSGTNEDGHPGEAIDAMTGKGGGGGAGGSFGSTGGSGGTGGNSGDTTAAGSPHKLDPVHGVVGGCPGGKGGNGNGSTSTFSGRAGQGGGAVYLLANSIRITGTINASGAGGWAGLLGFSSPNNNDSSGGGGGGGAGGLIGLEADSISVTGTLFANGGGGGAGGGGTPLGGIAGSGTDPSAANVAAAGGAGYHGGGSGGNGAACGTDVGAGGPGKDDSGSVTPESGGGGGGGGAGVIYLFSPQQPVLFSGAISPCP